VVAVERANYAKVARAIFEQQGTKLYPDATFTLRLSYGAVKGYTENGKQVTPFTTLGGLYARSNQFHHAFPYNDIHAIAKEPGIPFDQTKAIPITRMICCFRRTRRSFLI